MESTILKILEDSPLLKHLSKEQLQGLAARISKTADSDFLKKQIAEINRIDLDKWKEGERTNRDPGSDYVLSWIRQHGKDFHEKFLLSDCRTCGTVYKCINVVQEECPHYTPELLLQSRHIVHKILDTLRKQGAFKEDKVHLVEEIMARHQVAEKKPPDFIPGAKSEAA